MGVGYSSHFFSPLVKQKNRGRADLLSRLQCHGGYSDPCLVAWLDLLPGDHLFVLVNLAVYITRCLKLEMFCTASSAALQFNVLILLQPQMPVSQDSYSSIVKNARYLKETKGIYVGIYYINCLSHTAAKIMQRFITGRFI